MFLDQAGKEKRESMPVSTRESAPSLGDGSYPELAILMQERIRREVIYPVIGEGRDYSIRRASRRACKAITSKVVLGKGGMLLR